MGLYFYNYCGLHKLRKDLYKLSALNNKIFVIGFGRQTPMFLSRDYYKLLKELKSKSSKYNCNFLMCFYIKQDRHYLNAIYIKRGNVVSIIGESFTNKNMVIKERNKNILILFYFELYDITIKQRINFYNIDLTIGIDNEEISEDIVFLDNKFFNKLIILGENCKVKCKNKENILKIKENLVKYNVQNLTKLIK